MAKILNYQIHGEGYPIVFLHGFLESNSMWNYLPLHTFPIQAILIELPGHGASTLSNGIPSIYNMVKRVEDTLKSINLSKCSVIGHSMGGYVAIELKKKSPKIEKVVLLNSNYWADSKEKALDRQRIAQFIFQGQNLFLQEAVPNLFLHREHFKKDIKSLIHEAKQMKPDAIAYASIAMSKRKRNFHFIVDHLRDFYLIQGEKDSVAPRALWNPAIIENNPNYFEIMDCGHMTHIEKTEELTLILHKVFTNICSA